MIEDAQTYLQLYFRLPLAVRRGPHTFYQSKYDAGKMRALLDLVADEIQQVDWRTWRAPSSWHAAVYLLGVAETCAKLESPGCALFRGQRNPAWNVQASLYRATDQGLYKRAFEILFAAIRGMAFEEAPFLTDQVYGAAAQHYGLPTPLLDFTVDPLVAVYFACRDANEDDEVVVYWLPFNHALFMDFLVVLPPPWVRRLHRQRGVFLRSQADAQRSLDGACLRILFPTARAYPQWLHRIQQEEVLPENTWFEQAIQWSLKQASSVQVPVIEDSVLAEHLRAELGLPPFFLDSMRPDRLEGSLEYFLDVCDSLALKRLNNSGVDFLAYSCMPLRVIRRDNPGFFWSVLEIAKIVPADDPRRRHPFGQLASAIEECTRQAKALGGHWEIPVKWGR